MAEASRPASDPPPLLSSSPMKTSSSRSTTDLAVGGCSSNVTWEFRSPASKPYQSTWNRQPTWGSLSGWSSNASPSILTVVLFPGGSAAPAGEVPPNPTSQVPLVISANAMMNGTTRGAHPSRGPRTGSGLDMAQPSCSVPQPASPPLTCGLRACYTSPHQSSMTRLTRPRVTELNSTTALVVENRERAVDRRLTATTQCDDDVRGATLERARPASTRRPSDLASAPAKSTTT